jgi:urease subunit gamma/beta
MHLAPRERDKLVLVEVGLLAQRRLARGLRLNQPEAVGLIALVVLELIRDGRHSVAQLMSLGRTLLGRRQVLAGVPDLIPSVQVEGTFPDGTKLVTIHHPLAADDGNLSLALHGSFLPIPELTVFSASDDDHVESAPGEVMTSPGELSLNVGRECVSLSVTNLGDRPIQVGSYYHFIETNPYLRFDRARAYGLRLDIPAGTAVRFEPGENKTVHLVAIAGLRVIRGGNALADGPVTTAGLARAMERVRIGGFAHLPE